PELPPLGGALRGGGLRSAGLGVGRRRGLVPGPTAAPAGAPAPGTPAGSLARPVDDVAAPPAGRALALAGAPYLVLVGVVLVTRLVPPVQDALRSVSWSWTVADAFSGSVEPLYHPGTVLAVGFVAGVVANRLGRADVVAVVGYTVRKLGPVAVALLGMLGLSRLMVHAGMTDTLATAAAGAAGGLWPLLAPFVGTLGTFVTGSATASNILFTDFQVSTAQAVDLPVAAIAGGQNFGAATGNIICPHNIVAAGATVDLAGAEGEILRQTLWVAALYAAAGGLLALLVLT
ncbi:L-lactate permease, partial [Euzebya sp.]|uniref:L-lactate permease n=1 Tax=Euzebya sp. TaxID=1971409 RepID=UPI003512BC28